MRCGAVRGGAEPTTPVQYVIGGICDRVCTCPRFKRKTTIAINAKLGTHTLYGMILVKISPVVVEIFAGIC